MRVSTNAPPSSSTSSSSNFEFQQKAAEWFGLLTITTPIPPPYVNPDNEDGKETEVTKDQVQPTSSQSTARVQPPIEDNTTLNQSPPISLSPPSAGERLARCMALPAHSSPLLPSSRCPTQSQTLRITSTQALIDAVTAALPLPSLPPSLYIPPPVDRRDDIPESEQPPRKRLYLSTLGSRYEVGESSTARPTRGQGIDYGFISTVDAEERR
ncbi:hypothetical protein Tco_0375165 [Tanacetum coccineum]